MRKIALLAAVAASLALTGCAAGLSGGAKGLGEQALGNLEHCDRTYIGNAGLGASLSVNITCKAKPFDAPLVP